MKTSKFLTRAIRKSHTSNDLRQCSECGRLFLSIGNNSLCERCRAKYVDQEELVREFVMKNRGVTIIEVAERIGVPVTLVRRMVDEGKLDLKNLVPGNRCRTCGADIAIGTYCSKCLEKMKRQIETVKENFAQKMQIRSSGDTDPLRRKTGEKIRSDSSKI